MACGAFQVPGVLPKATSPIPLAALHPKTPVYFSYSYDSIGTKGLQRQGSVTPMGEVISKLHPMACLGPPPAPPIVKKSFPEGTPDSPAHPCSIPERARPGPFPPRPGRTGRPVNGWPEPLPRRPYTAPARTTVRLHRSRPLPGDSLLQLATLFPRQIKVKFKGVASGQTVWVHTLLVTCATWQP